jgi:hypothetical protein
MIKSKLAVSPKESLDFFPRDSLVGLLPIITYVYTQIRRKHVVEIIHMAVFLDLSLKGSTTSFT